MKFDKIEMQSKCLKEKCIIIFNYVYSIQQHLLIMTIMCHDNLFCNCCHYFANDVVTMVICLIYTG